MVKFDCDAGYVLVITRVIIIINSIIMMIIKMIMIKIMMIMQGWWASALVLWFWRLELAGAGRRQLCPRETVQHHAGEHYNKDDDDNDNDNDDTDNNGNNDDNDLDHWQAGITAGISLAVLVPVACCIVCLLQRYMGGGADWGDQLK